MKPTERITGPDGSLLEYFDIPIRPGGAVLHNKPLRLAAIRERTLEERGTLLALTYDLFVENWSRVRFGPCIEGAVFELELAAEPEVFSLLDGYLTVEFPPGPAHFHLCVGPTEGLKDRKTPPELARQRQCGRAALFRTFSKEGCSPGSWGVRLWNGSGEQMLSVFLPSPFLDDRLKRLREPDFTRLSLWRELCQRYLGAIPEELIA
jgi:hypothetical protein